MKKNYTLVALLFFTCSVCSIAQVNYSFSAATAAYVPVTGGITPTLFMSPYDYDGNTSYTYDEGMANAIPIGFTFNYNGINYTNININANGFATLGSPFLQVASENYFINSLRLGPITVYTPVPGDTITNPSTKPILAPFWDDLTCQADADLRYATTGSSGNRVFTFEWSNVRWQYDATQSTLSFELKLYEGSNQIEFCYKDEGGTPSAGASASIGITANSHQGGGFMSLQNTSSSPSVSTSVETDNLNIKPANNQVYKFTPLPCGLPFNVHYDSYTNTSVNFSWDAPPQVSSFEYTVNTSPYDPATGTSTSSKNAVVSSLTPNTKYYIHVRSYCSVTSQSLWLTEDTFRTANNPVSLPYSEGFESGNQNLSSDFPGNFRQQDVNDTVPYYYSYNSWQSRADLSPYAHSGSQFMIYPDEIYKANDWFYLPGFNLTAGKSYKLKFYYAAPFDEFNPNGLEVKYGQAVGATAMTSGILFNNNAINNINYIADSSIITPVASGLYFIGFHCYSDSAKGEISIDDISLEVTNALSVTLLNFSGEVNGKQNLLHWSTVSEQNNTGFEVQRSNDGYGFNKVGFVNSKAVNGNSNFKLNYDFSDIAFTVSANYYRLKQIDKDGKFSYSNIVLLRDQNPAADSTISVYPNPAKNILNIKIFAHNSKDIKLSVIDISGKIFLTKSTLVSDGETIIQVDVSHLAAGTYFIKSISADGNEKTVKKFVKQ